MASPDRPPILERVHDLFVLLLVAMRPWCWDGMPGQPADQVWQGLAVGSLIIVAIERAAGLRQAWAWSWRGVVAVVLVAALLPAVLGAAEPSPAWCRWSGWVACLAAAAYLMQVLPGRQRLVFAALAAGLAVTATLGVTQAAFALPAMAAAQQAKDTVFSAIAGDPGSVAERIANGGAFATFTLANQLGSYLALLLPLAVGVAWTAGGRMRWYAAALGVLALAALAVTGAKGAWLALAAGAGFAWWLTWRGRWWRWLPLPLGAVALAALLHSGVAQASIAVREGYWRSAVILTNEAPLTGHGLGGFAAHQSRVMLPGDESTRFVHNEVLEAAVAGGWGLAALLVAALTALVWPRRPAIEAEPAAGPAHALAWTLLIAVPYLTLLRAFDGNLGWWPGGTDQLIKLAWAALLGLLAALTMQALWRAPPPPAWAWAAGLCAVALKALIDFDLHAGGVIGTAMLVAVCAGGPWRQACGAFGRWLPLVAALAAAALVLAGMSTALRLNEAEDWLALARQCEDPRIAVQAGERLGADPATPPRVLAGKAAQLAWNAAEGAPGLRSAALEMLPPGQQTLEMCETLATEAPYSASIALQHAGLLLGARSWSAAVAEAERATRLAPSSPRTFDMAAEVAERAAKALPSSATQAAAWRVEAERLRPLARGR